MHAFWWMFETKEIKKSSIWVWNATGWFWHNKFYGDKITIANRMDLTRLLCRNNWNCSNFSWLWSRVVHNVNTRSRLGRGIPGYLGHGWELRNPGPWTVDPTFCMQYRYSNLYCGSRRFKWTFQIRVVYLYEQRVNELNWWTVVIPDICRYILERDDKLHCFVRGFENDKCKKLKHTMSQLSSRWVRNCKTVHRWSTYTNRALIDKRALSCHDLVRC